MSILSAPTASQTLAPARRPTGRVWLKHSLVLLLALVIVLPLAGATYQVIATEIDARAYPPPGQRVVVGSHQLHLQCVGIGSPTVITESGLGGTSLDWSLVRPIVGETTRICSYDRAGFGWSDAGPFPRTSQQIVTELHTLLANAGIPGPYVLAGHSAGGMHVQVYASLYPDDVAGLVLVDPTPAQLMMRFSAEERHQRLPDPNQLRLFWVLQTLGVMRFMPLPGEEALKPLPLELQRAVRAVNLRSGSAATLYDEAVVSLETSLMQTAAARPLPVARPFIIVWHGIPAEPVELEPIARASMDELVQRSANAKLVIAANSSHYIPFDRPDVVSAAILDAVKSVRTGAPVAQP